MLKQVNALKTVKIINNNSIPDGTYIGKYGGYILEIEANNEILSITTDYGIRGMNVPCNVFIVEGNIIVEI